MTAMEECPRCGGDLDPTASAMSRITAPREIAICSTCGALEAHRDAWGLPPMPPSDWPVHPLELGREFALWKDFEQKGERVELSPDDVEGLFPSEEIQRLRDAEDERCED
jgi:hypothetical protein